MCIDMIELHPPQCIKLRLLKNKNWIVFNILILGLTEG